MTPLLKSVCKIKQRLRLSKNIFPLNSSPDSYFVDGKVRVPKRYEPKDIVFANKKGHEDF
jgi:hypothetical protein